ncbi:erythromycin esterase family protein [Natronosporangium hydrolyticum]|uniref:Erythromycin esterase family protein n=1 Tax=Natronosporangium hydrolyticum TaxID=2811111 RepID=A0A895YKS9_9ACTN|nr:erythromycin esterase family protein [Natronosporangium hydrolyticum]QSB16622.1 erythromycin esterase family protein [Natronosporangium hydrolyticum]
MTTQPTRTADLITNLAEHATVVGLGTSTREAHELFRQVEATTLRLVERGFRTIAILDNQRVGELYDQYLGGADLDLDSVLAQAWGPWQVVEMRQTLTALREHNRRHPNDPVRLLGIEGPRALPADYDRVLELLDGIDPPAAAAARGPLEVIRRAHSTGEHVLRALGTHPGTPFVELARAGREATAALPDGAERDEAVRLLDLIVEFHADAIGVGYDQDRAEQAAATRLLAHHQASGDRIVLWEGSAHVAAHGGPTLGSYLRQALGDQYVAVHLTFGAGRTPRHEIPPARAGSLEGTLTAGGGERVVDLRAAAAADPPVALDRRWQIRLISGRYDPARDDDHYYEFPSLADSFDAIAFTPTITPVEPLEL